MMDKVTCEESNYLRLLLLLNNICAKVVRDKFDYELHPQQLQKELYRKQIELKGNKSINKGQWNLLFPMSGEVSSKTFDVTLMINLLRSLADLSVGDLLPHENDISIAADLSRIKFYRNKMGHIADGRVTDDDFHDYWKDISQAVVRIGGKQYQIMCASVRDKRLDADPIPIGLQVAHSQIIQNWLLNEEKVIKTDAISDLTDLLLKHDFVTLVGASGCGKSTALHHVALEFQQQDYEIVPADTPDDIFNYFNNRKKQFFVYDDVCGEFSLNAQRVEEWSSKSTKIQALIGRKSIKIAVCCRTYIFKHRQFQNVSLLTKTVKHCDVSYDEKILIAQMYLTENEVTALKEIQDCLNYEFFPLLCRVYATKSNRDVFNFFSNPKQVIKDDMISIMTQDDQTIYATLALFVVYNNCINEDLESMVNIDQVLEDLSKKCIIKYVLNEQKVKGQLADLTTSYVKKVGNNYSVMHEKLFDILVSFYGEHLFPFILKFCHHDIVRDRYQFESIDSKVDENVITIPERYESLFFRRLQKDMCENNHVVNVFTNRQLQYESYRSKFICYACTENEVKSYILFLTNKPESPLLIAAANGHYDIVEMLIEFEMNINVKDINKKTPLCLAVENGHAALVEFLIKTNADTKIYDSDNNIINLLYIASAKGYIKIVEILLSSDSDPNMCREDGEFEGETPLYIASKNGHFDIVDLLLQCGSNPIFCKRGLKYEGETPLYIAASMGHTQIVKRLLDVGCEPNVCKLDQCHDGETPLFVASEKGYTEIVQLLLMKGADPNMCARSVGRDLAYDRESPLHIAVEHGHSEIIKLLLNIDNINPNTKYKCNPNLCRNDEDNRGVTALFIAADKGYIEIVKMLLIKKADPDLCKLSRHSVAKTPMDVALLHGHNQIVTLLRDYYFDED